MSRSEMGGIVPPEAHQLAHRDIPIAGLMPESVRAIVRGVRREAGRLIVDKVQEYKPDNLLEKLSEVDAVTQQNPWLERLFQDASQGKKSAIFTIGVGTLSIIAAATAGVEFGVRGGKDIKELYNHLQDFRSRHEKA